MIDGEDRDDSDLMICQEDDPIVASVGTVLSLQLESQPVPDALRVLGQRAVGELDDGRGDLLRQ